MRNRRAHCSVYPNTQRGTRTMNSRAHCSVYPNIQKGTRTMNSRAQMKIQQMAFVLMAITLFFILVGLFVMSIFLTNLREEASQLEEKNAMLLATKLSESPEFSCGNSFSGSKISCIDADKLMALKQNVDKYTAGKNFWGVEGIKVRKIYPKLDSRNSNEIECTGRNYPDCNSIVLFEDNINHSAGTYSNFVTLCRKESSEGKSYDQCDVGRLIIYPKNKRY